MRITRNRFFNIALCVHILCGILGVMIICLVPEKDHVRWGLGYLVGYLFFFSLVLLSFLPKGLPRRMKIGLRIYRAVYWVGALVLMFIPKGLFLLFVLLYECGSNSTRIAEDGQYIIRLYVTASLFDDYNEKRIYRKQGILEKYVGSFDAGDNPSALTKSGRHLPANAARWLKWRTGIIPTTASCRSPSCSPYIEFAIAG